MSDQPNPQAGNGSDQPPVQPTAETVDSLPPWAQKIINELRKENAGHRTARKAADDAARAAEEQRLREKEDYAELAKGYRTRLDELEPLETQAEQLAAAFNASLDNRLKDIPKEVREKMVDPVRAKMSPVDFSNWLDANLGIMRARPAPNLDPGAGGSGAGGKSGPTPTAEDMTMAKNFRMTVPQWMEQKAEMERDRAAGTERQLSDLDKQPPTR